MNLAFIESTKGMTQEQAQALKSRLILYATSYELALYTDSEQARLIAISLRDLGYPVVPMFHKVGMEIDILLVAPHICLLRQHAGSKLWSAVQYAREHRLQSVIILPNGQTHVAYGRGIYDA